MALSFLTLGLISLASVLFVTTQPSRIFLNIGIGLFILGYVVLSFVPTQRLYLPLIALVFAVFFTELSSNDASSLPWLRNWANNPSHSLASGIIAAVAWLTFVYALAARNGRSDG